MKLKITCILALAIILFAGCDFDDDSSDNVLPEERTITVNYDTETIECYHDIWKMESGDEAKESDFPLAFTSKNPELIPVSWKVDGVQKSTEKEFFLEYSDLNSNVKSITVTLTTRQLKTVTLNFDDTKFAVYSKSFLDRTEVLNGGQTKEGKEIDIYPFERNIVIEKYKFNDKVSKTLMTDNSLTSETITEEMISSEGKITITAVTHEALTATFNYPSSIYPHITQNNYVRDTTQTYIKYNRETSDIRDQTSCEVYEGEEISFKNVSDGKKTNQTLIVNGTAAKAIGTKIRKNADGELYIKALISEDNQVDVKADNGAFTIALE